MTGAAETGNYFSLRLDAYKQVETLTCLSRTPLPVSNYLCLYGKHEQLLGQLISSYKQALITDLYRWEEELQLASFTSQGRQKKLAWTDIQEIFQKC